MPEIDLDMAKMPAGWHARPDVIVSKKISTTKPHVYDGTLRMVATPENIVTSERVAEWLGFSGQKLGRGSNVGRIVAGVMRNLGWERHYQRVPGNTPKKGIWVHPFTIMQEQGMRTERSRALYAKWRAERAKYTRKDDNA